MDPGTRRAARAPGGTTARAPGEDSAGLGHEEPRAAAGDARDDGRWFPVYVAVVVVTALVIAGLWLFSRAFSS
ncbi:MAG TPA: hypothetical protein VGX48_08945 [Pyrinomonadaceae bacterium]|jgi:hypothetical protein|nr:hypothetical protein [Pyrinomonadaceae bacterium]